MTSIIYHRRLCNNFFKKKLHELTTNTYTQSMIMYIVTNLPGVFGAHILYMYIFHSFRIL